MPERPNSNFIKLRGEEAAAVVQRQETAAGFLDFPAVWRSHTAHPGWTRIFGDSLSWPILTAKPDLGVTSSG